MKARSHSVCEKVIFIRGRRMCALEKFWIMISGLTYSFEDQSRYPMEPKEIIEHLNISRDTFFVGISKLRDHGLYDFKARSGGTKHVAQERPPRKP